MPWTHLKLFILKQLQANVIEQQAHIGIALDGDGDRVVLVDEQANIITADRLLSLFSQMCLENHPVTQWYSMLNVPAWFVIRFETWVDIHI